MAQRRVVVGTTPVILANANAQRASIVISMLPTSVETGNTGRVHVGKGFVPSSVLGASNRGDPLPQGTEVSDIAQFSGDPSLFKGQWWAVASAADQILTVDEMSAGPAKAV